MTDASHAEAFWEDAADKYEQIVADGGDPEIDPAFSLNQRNLETVRLIVGKRERPEG